jgi:hypothetical protein
MTLRPAADQPLVLLSALESCAASGCDSFNSQDPSKNRYSLETHWGLQAVGCFPLFVTEHPSAVQCHAPVTASLLSKSAPSKKIQSLNTP